MSVTERCLMLLHQGFEVDGDQGGEKRTMDRLHETNAAQLLICAGQSAMFISS